MGLRLLMIDDSQDDVDLAVFHLRRAGLEIVWRRIETASALESTLGSDTWDAILCDNAMPTLNALEALSIVKNLGVDLPFIVLSGTVGEETAADYMRLGAHDLVLKGNLGRLVPALEREIAEAVERSEFTKVREQLRKSEELLVRSERLRALGEMAAGIAHDMRNLLNPIYLEAQIAERGCRSGESAEWIEASVGEIKRLTARSVEVLERLRNFTRPTHATKRERLDLNALVIEASDIARPRLASRASTCRVVEELGAPPSIMGLPGEVLGAVVNLIVNAIDAMPKGGTIRLQTGESKNGPWIAVEDNGPGIDPDTAARVFEPFFTTKGDQGTGLGLATVRGCMEQHAGSVSLETTPGKGCRFTLWFPPHDRTAASD